jgi:hypothetical protein
MRAPADAANWALETQWKKSLLRGHPERPSGDPGSSHAHLCGHDHGARTYPLIASSTLGSESRLAVIWLQDFEEEEERNPSPAPSMNGRIPC